jgi:hypothetical protein
LGPRQFQLSNPYVPKTITAFVDHDGYPLQFASTFQTAANIIEDNPALGIFSFPASITYTPSYNPTITTGTVVTACYIAHGRVGGNNTNPSGVGVTDGTDTFDLGAPFWIATSRVWLDGVSQVLGTDYTEEPDDGLIIFTSLPAEGLDVVVTRVTRTPLGGGPSRRVS